MIHKYFTTSLLYSYMIYCFAYRGRKYTQLIQCNVKAFYSDNHIQCYKQTTVKIFLNRHLYKTVTQSKSLQFLSLHPLFEFPLERHLSKMYTQSWSYKKLSVVITKGQGSAQATLIEGKNTLTLMLSFAQVSRDIRSKWP